MPSRSRRALTGSPLLQVELKSTVHTMGPQYGIPVWGPYVPVVEHIYQDRGPIEQDPTLPGPAIRP